MKQIGKKSRYRFTLGLIFSTLLLSPNYLGLSLKIDHPNITKSISSRPGILVFSNDESSFSRTNAWEKLTIVTSSPWHGISWAVVAIIFTIMIIAPYISVLGIRFLKDRPLNKQSILNKLCRDCARIQIAFLVVWTTYIVTAKCIEDPENWTLYLQLSKLFSYANEALFSLGMLYVCFIGCLRLYTIRYQVLDPLEEWFGEHEDMALLCIRIIMAALNILYIGIVSSTSATPILYYKLTENDRNWEEVSWKSRLKLGFNITCCTIALVLFTAGKIIQRKKDAAALAETFQVPMSNAGEQYNGRNDLTYYVSSVSIIYLASTLLLLIVILLVYLGVIYINVWWGVAMLIGVQGIGMPIVFLSLNLAFRNYCWRQVRGDLNNFIRCINRCVSAIQQLSSRVTPLQ